MAESIGSVHYDLDIDDKDLKKQLDSADKKVSDFGKSLHDGLNKAAAGFAIVGAGLTLISKQATDFTVDTVRSSKGLATQIGTTTEEASRLVAAFGRMGVSAQDASQVFGIFSKNITKATQDSKDQAQAMNSAQIAIEKTQRQIADTTAEIKKNGDKSGDLNFKLKELNATLADQRAKLSESSNAFQKLGVSTTDAGGKQKDFNTILFEVADKFKAMPNGIDKTSLALELFGRSGKDMIKVLNLGSSGIKDLEAQADKLGLTLTSQNIAAVNEYIKSQKDLKATTDALKIAIGTTTTPVLTSFNQTLNDVALKLLESDGIVRTMTIGVLAFGGPIAGAAAGVLAFAANLVTAWPAIAATTAGMWGMATAVIAATWPFILIGLAVAAATLLIIANWNSVWGFLQAVFNWIRGNWGSILFFLVNPFNAAHGLIMGAMMELGMVSLGFSRMRQAGFLMLVKAS
jgi:hypothetical protein